MKRLVLILGLAAFLVLGVGAQIFPSMPGQNSLEYFLTARLFPNSIDESFTFDSQFGSVSSPFLFTGVSGNPNMLANLSSAASSFIGGYYQPGKLPFSALLDFSAATLATPLSVDATVTTYGNKNVTVGTTTTAREYVASTATTKYSQPSALGSLTLTLTGILKIAGVTTGLDFYQNSDWSTTNGGSAYYASTTTVTNYDTTGAGVAPVVATNFTTAETTKNVNPAALPAVGATVATQPTGQYATSSTSIFYLPFALATSKIKHQGFVKLALASTDSSGSYSISETAHAGTAGTTVTDRNVNITKTDSFTTIAALYLATLPGFALADKGGVFTAGVSLSDRIDTTKYDYADTDKTYNVATLNAKTGTSGFSTVSQASYDPGNYLDIAAYIAHSLPLVTNDILKFSIKPETVFEFTNDDNTAGIGILRSRTYYTQGLNAGFSYDSGTYTKTSITVTGPVASQSTFGIAANLPTALEIRPKGWAFGFMAGATPKVSLKWTTVKAAASTTTTTVDTITAGAVTGSVVTPVTTSGGSTTSLALATSEVHSFGLFIPFGEADKYRLDIFISGTDITYVNQFTMQVYIPLK